eukprot:m.180469 g.180469  ORF g.180469 m.180469 type:complete len:422 (+) comp53446_c0_seq7:354-1619(+)
MPAPALYKLVSGLPAPVMIDDMICTRFSLLAGPECKTKPKGRIDLEIWVSNISLFSPDVYQRFAHFCNEREFNLPVCSTSCPPALGFRVTDRLQAPAGGVARPKTPPRDLQAQAASTTTTKPSAQHAVSTSTPSRSTESQDVLVTPVASPRPALSPLHSSASMDGPNDLTQSFLVSTAAKPHEEDEEYTEVHDEENEGWVVLAEEADLASSFVIGPDHFSPSVEAADQRDASNTLFVPGHAESLELYAWNIVVGMGHHRSVAELILTDFRLVLVCHDGHFCGSLGDRHALKLAQSHHYDLSTQVPLGSILEVTFVNPARQMHKVLSFDNLLTPLKQAPSFPEVTIRCRDFRTIKLIFTEQCSEPAVELASALYRRLLAVILNLPEVPISCKFGQLTVGQNFMEISSLSLYGRAPSNPLSVA